MPLFPPAAPFGPRWTLPHRPMSHTGGTAARPPCKALGAVLACLMSLTLGGTPAATAASPTPPGADSLAALIADGVDVAVTGQYLVAADGDPQAPESVVRLDSGAFVPVDPASVDPAVESGDMIAATVEVPGAIVASLPSATLAEIAASGDIPATATGPIDAGGDLAGLVLDAAAESSEHLVVADESVLEVAQSPGSAEAVPGPYVHTMHVVFITRDSRRVFWTKAQLDGYVNGLSQWWNRESRGAVTATYNWNDVVGIQSDVQCSSSLLEVQTAATNALAAAGKPVYNWTTNASQHHLVVLTASDEETGSCSHSFAGHGWLLADFSSPGAMRNIVSASADTSQPSPLSTFIHEMGHNFGLSHAGSLTCAAGTFDGPITGSGACTVANYGNQYNIMGYSYGSLAYSILGSQKTREHLITNGEGYLTVDQPVSDGVYAISAASTTDLTARQALRIVDSAGGQQRTYWVDYLANAEGGGVEITRAHARTETNEPESLMLFPAHKATTGQLLFHRGDSFFSSTGTLRITVEEITPTEAYVRVTLATSHPGVNLSQDQWAPTPGGGTKTVFVDAGGSAWTASSSDSWLTVSPAASSGTTLTMTAASLNGGEREATVTVTSGSRTATISVSQVDTDDCAATTSTTCAFALNTEVATARGSLERGSDKDWWRVVPSTSGTWTAMSNGTGDVYGSVMGSGGSVIAWDDDTAGDRQFLLTWDAIAGEPYYIEIRNFASSDTTVNTGPYTITAAPARVGLSAETWDAPVDGAALGVTVTSTTKRFSATSSAPWLTVSPASGSNALAGQTVTVTAAASTAPARTGTVTFAAGTATTTLTVTQAREPATMTVHPESATVTGAPASMVARVSLSHGTWTIRSQPSWVTIMPTSGVSGDVMIDIGGNDGAERTGTIVFASGDVTAQVTIVQSAGELTLSPTEWLAPGRASARTAELTSDLPWSVAAPSWLEVDPSSGGPGSQTLSLSAADNPSPHGRSGSVEVSAGALTGTIAVTQAAGTSIAVGPSPWSAGAFASTTTVIVDTDGSPWHVASLSPWLTAEPTSGIGNAIVTLTTATNSGPARQGEVVFATDADTATVLVAQAAAPTGITVTPTRWDLGYGPDSTEAEVSLDYGTWTLQSTPAWIRVTPDGGQAGPVTLTAEANNGLAREDTVVFSSNGETASVLVHQAEAPVALTVLPEAMMLGGEASQASVQVSLNVGTWTVESSPSWVTVTPASGPAGTHALVVAASANPGTAARSGSVVVAAGDVRRTVLVAQTGTTSIEVNPRSWSPSGSPSSITITVDTDGSPWRVSSLPPWITASPLTGVGDATVTLTAAVNTVSGSRTGTVVFATDRDSVAVPVTQGPPPTLSVSRTSWSAPARGGSTTATVTTNHTGWSASSDVPWLSVTPSSGTSGTRVSVTALAASVPATTTGTVTFTAGGVTRTMTVTQAAGTLTLSRRTWSADDRGANTTTRVTTVQPVWTATSTESWLAISPATGGSGDSIRLVAAVNAGTSRTAVVHVVAGGMAADMTVTQDSAPAPTMSLTRTSWTADAGGDATSSRVTTNQAAWAAEVDATWLSVSPASGVSGTTMEVRAAGNPGLARTGHVTVHATGPVGSISRVVTVSQRAATLTTSVSSWSPSSAGAMTTPTVSTDQPGWTASSDADWLHVAPAAGVDGDEMVWVA
ncbi:MAG: hypothetical protein LBK59_10840, partial [Bifidobacteriaceae bacterium]|nr:hypothetical protein [Bifidobacteriaceae bacterium]